MPASHVCNVPSTLSPTPPCPGQHTRPPHLRICCSRMPLIACHTSSRTHAYLLKFIHRVIAPSQVLGAGGVSVTVLVPPLPANKVKKSTCFRTSELIPPIFSYHFPTSGAQPTPGVSRGGKRPVVKLCSPYPRLFFLAEQDEHRIDGSCVVLSNALRSGFHFFNVHDLYKN